MKQQADGHKAAMEALELDYAVRTALTDAHDAGIVAGLLDRTKLRLRDGSVEGLEEQLKGLREGKPFLFKAPGQPAKPAFTGKVPASPTAKPGGTVRLLVQENVRGRKRNPPQFFFPIGSRHFAA